MNGGARAFLSVYAVLMGLLGLELGIMAAVMVLLPNNIHVAGVSDDVLFIVGLILFWGSIWWAADQAFAGWVERLERSAEDGRD